MGNSTSANSSTQATTDKLTHSFEEINKGASTLKSLGLDSEEKQIIKKHRFSEPKLNDKGLRDQYFRKLSKGKKDHEDLRMSLKSNSLNKGDLLAEDYDNLSYMNNSFMSRQMNSNESMVDLEMKSSFNRLKSKHTSRSNSGRNSRESSKERVSQVSEQINITSKREKKPLRRSLSQKTNEQSSFTNTRNTLFLNNQVESEFNPEALEAAANTAIDIKNRRSIRKTYSSDVISSTFKQETTLDNENPNESESQQGRNDTVSEFSNIYSTQKSRFSVQNNDYELNFVKNGEDLRRSYIAKLIYKKVWQPSKKERDHNTLIIFDWDDTLLCTSFLTPNGIFNEDIELNDKEKEKLAKLEFSTLRILTAAIERGDTYIITNAAPGWVEYSSERFYPSVRKLLDKVKIISARGDYESLYPGDSRMWKIQAFLNMQKTFDNNLVTNIICLGDSFIEMEAGHVLASKFSQAFIKTIKFRESPKPEELNKQLSLVADQFPVIYSTIKNLTIRVEKKVKK